MELNAVSGSFIMNPPMLCNELIEAALDHVERLLSESNEPLSFVVMLSESESTFIKKLDSSSFKRREVVIPAYEHYYRHGFQYAIPRYMLDLICVACRLNTDFDGDISGQRLMYDLLLVH